jgi:hypothetical protein
VTEEEIYRRTFGKALVEIDHVEAASIGHSGK